MESGFWPLYGAAARARHSTSLIWLGSTIKRTVRQHTFASITVRDFLDWGSPCGAVTAYEANNLVRAVHGASLEVGLRACPRSSTSKFRSLGWLFL